MKGSYHGSYQSIGLEPWIKWLQRKKYLNKSLHGVFANMLDSDIVVSSNSSHAITFTFRLWESMNRLTFLVKWYYYLFFYKDSLSIK